MHYLQGETQPAGDTDPVVVAQRLSHDLATLRNVVWPPAQAATAASDEAARQAPVSILDVLQVQLCLLDCSVELTAKTPTYALVIGKTLPASLYCKLRLPEGAEGGALLAEPIPPGSCPWAPSLGLSASSDAHTSLTGSGVQVLP